jgi:hypothetical protein
LRGSPKLLLFGRLSRPVGRCRKKTALSEARSGGIREILPEVVDRA